MSYTVIESPDGQETQFVADRGDKTLDGYDGWTVLGTCARAPEDGETWDKAGKALAVDTEYKATREREAMARDPAALLDKIEALEVRVAALEAPRVA